MKLYYIPLTSSFRPRWLLLEAGLEHELIRLTLAPEHIKTPEYRKIHPLGQVPALVDGDLTLIESAAICMYLSEKAAHSGLSPASGTRERALYYQWILYAMDTVSPVVHAPYLRWFLASPDQKAHASTEEDHAAFGRVLEPVLGALLSSPFLLGEQLTTADVVMGGVLQWAEATGQLARSPIARAYHERLAARPAYQRALQ